MRKLAAKLRRAIDANDIVGVIGIACLAYGLERIYAGSGFAGAGAVMLYAVLRAK